MTQAAIRCPLRGLELVGTPISGYAPVIVGGVDALATDNGDTSYVDLDAEPDVSSGAYLEGTFDAAAIPTGHLVTGMFLAVKMRGGIGSTGDSQIFVGVWDGAQFTTKEDAQDAGWLWGDYFISPEDGATYAYADPVYDATPEFGFTVLGDANDWSNVQTNAFGDEFSFTLANLRAGTVKGYLQSEAFYGDPAGTWLSRVTSMELVIRHAPIPDPWPATYPDPPSHTPYEAVPNLVDIEDVYGASRKANVSENETRTGMGGGGGVNWNQGAIDAFYAELVEGRAPDDGFASTSDTANGLYVSFVFERLRATASPPSVNLQNRMSIWKHVPYENALYVNSSAFSTPEYEHQRATIGENDDPLWDYAGLVYTSDDQIEWGRLVGDEYVADYRLEVEKFEIRIYNASSATGDNYSAYATRLMELEAYDYTETMNSVTPDEVTEYSTDLSILIDSRAGGTLAAYDYFTWPTIAGEDLAGALDLLTSQEIPAIFPTEEDDPTFNSSDYVDVTDRMELDAHGQPCVFVYFAQNDQHLAHPFAPGTFSVNGQFERSIHGSIGGRYELAFPDRRYPYRPLSPLNDAVPAPDIRSSTHPARLRWL